MRIEFQINDLEDELLGISQKNERWHKQQAIQQKRQELQHLVLPLKWPQFLAYADKSYSQFLACLCFAYESSKLAVARLVTLQHTRSSTHAAAHMHLHARTSTQTSTHASCISPHQHAWKLSGPNASVLAANSRQTMISKYMTQHWVSAGGRCIPRSLFGHCFAASRTQHSSATVRLGQPGSGRLVQPFRL